MVVASTLMLSRGQSRELCWGSPSVAGAIIPEELAAHGQHTASGERLRPALGHTSAGGGSPRMIWTHPSGAALHPRTQDITKDNNLSQNGLSRDDG